MPADVRISKLKMPSIYAKKNESSLFCKVGYYVNSKGKRDRREFRLGADALPAHKKAIRLEELWLKELARHKRLLAQDQEVFPNDPKYLPVWTGMPEVEREAREAYLSPPWPSLHRPSAPSPGR